MKKYWIWLLPCLLIACNNQHETKQVETQTDVPSNEVSNTPEVKKTEDGWAILDTEEFSVEYPADWELNLSGVNRSTFALYSPVLKEKQDVFREHFTLVINLADSNLTLPQYTEICLSSLERLMPGAKLLSSESGKDETGEYQEVVFEDDSDKTKRYLKYKQIYRIHDYHAYTFSFTAEEFEYDNYEADADRIFHSFKFKDKQ